MYQLNCFRFVKEGLGAFAVRETVQSGDVHGRDDEDYTAEGRRAEHAEGVKNLIIGDGFFDVLNKGGHHAQEVVTEVLASMVQWDGKHIRLVRAEITNRMGPSNGDSLLSALIGMKRSTLIQLNRLLGL